MTHLVANQPSRITIAPRQWLAAPLPKQRATQIPTSWLQGNQTRRSLMGLQRRILYMIFIFIFIFFKWE